MSDSDPGPRPEPEIEPGEPNPGGPDAVPDSDGVDGEETDGNPVSRDLDPDDNPAVDDAMPDEMKQPEDTETEATKSDDGAGGEDVPPEEESPA